MIRNSNSTNVQILMRSIAIRLFGKDRVHDTQLPPDGVPYPFAYLAGNVVLPVYTKGNEIEDVSITIRFYHDDVNERAILDSMMYAMRIESGMKRFNQNNSSIRLIDYNSTFNPEDQPNGTKLLHGILTLTFRCCDTTL